MQFQVQLWFRDGQWTARVRDTATGREFHRPVGAQFPREEAANQAVLGVCETLGVAASSTQYELEPPEDQQSL